MRKNSIYKKFLQMLNQFEQQILAESHWGGERFEKVKGVMSNTHIGELGENFVEELLKESKKFNVVERPPSKRGEYDIMVDGIKFEIKTATMDISMAFQFNGIRYDTKYDYLLLFGISPTDLYYKIVKNVRDIKMVSMAKNSNASFKHTVKPSDLNNIEKLIGDITNLI